MTSTILYIGTQSLHKTLSKIFPEIVFLKSFSELVKTVKRQYPHMIFCEDTAPDTSIHNTGKIRALFPEVQIPIVIWGTKSWLPYQKTSLDTLGNSYRISPSLAPQRIRDQIELLLDMTYFDREEGVQHPHALGLLIRTFREEQNGFLFNPYRNIPLRDGGVITIDAEEQLKLFLLEPEPQFEEREESGLGDWLLIMDMIWNILQSQAHPGFLSKRKKLRISTHAQYNRLFSLPLSSNTLTFLFETDPKDTVSNRLQQLNLPQSAIEKELEILYTMGFCSFVLPAKEETSLPKLQLTTFRNEEEGWAKIPLLRQSQNVLLDKASPHFWRTLIAQQQNAQSNDMYALLQANQYKEVLYRLKVIPAPSWEELQLICWAQIMLNPKQERRKKQLHWLHEQSPTIASSLFLCTLSSEEANFHTAQDYLQKAQDLAGSMKSLAIIKKKLQSQTPVPRSVSYSAIKQLQSQRPTSQ